MSKAYVYIMSNQIRGTIYTGMTTDIVRRIYEHRNHLVDGFTKQHNLTKLVYYEVSDSLDSALYRERNIKDYRRQWKINLIEENNPFWSDLYPTLF